MALGAQRHAKRMALDTSKACHGNHSSGSGGARAALPGARTALTSARTALTRARKALSGEAVLSTC